MSTGELVADAVAIVARDEITIVCIQPADGRVRGYRRRKCRQVFGIAIVPVGSVPMKLPAIVLPPLVCRLMPIPRKLLITNPGQCCRRRRSSGRCRQARRAPLSTE